MAVLRRSKECLSCLYVQFPSSFRERPSHGRTELMIIGPSTEQARSTTCCCDQNGQCVSCQEGDMVKFDAVYRSLLLSGWRDMVYSYCGASSDESMIPNGAVNGCIQSRDPMLFCLLAPTTCARMPSVWFRSSHLALGQMDTTARQTDVVQCPHYFR